MPDVVLLGSITDLRPDHAGGVVVSGSHGGMYPAALASRGGVRAVIFNDAGIGRDRAGIAGVLALEQVGVAAAATDCMTCRIGSAEDMIAHGRLSNVNAVAAALGLADGQSVADAARMLLYGARPPTGVLPVPRETRQVRTLAGGPVVLLLDSASMVEPDDAGEIVITGSHGALIGGDPARALKAPARLAVFNDAGGGKDAVGFSRLPALDTQGVAAVTVSHMTARIGDAESALDTGVVSSVNARAKASGARPGQPLSKLLARFAGRG